jgi:hypothetical protein
MKPKLKNRGGSEHQAIVAGNGAPAHLKMWAVVEVHKPTTIAQRRIELMPHTVLAYFDTLALIEARRCSSCSQLRCHHRFKIGDLEHRADFDLAFLRVWVWATLDPIHGLF